MSEKRPKTMADIPADWKPTMRRVVIEEVQVKQRGPWLVWLVGLIAVGTLIGFVVVWKTSGTAPAAANGASPAAPPASATSIAAALDSGRTLSRQGEWGKAEAVLRAAAQRAPEDQEIRVALAEACLGLKRYPESYEQYEKALAIGPRDSKLEFAAGQVASQAGMNDRAIEHYSMAQASDPKNPSIPLMLGLAQRKAGTIDAAKASLLRAANLDPSNAYAWGSMADIALNENNLELASQHIAKARQLQPESKEWRLIEARVLARKGDPERALMGLLPMDPSQKREAQVARLIAQCYGMLNRPRDAAATLADAAESDPKNADLAFEAGTAMLHAGDKPKAREFALRAKELGHQGADDLLTKLARD
jgi:tetratricopeptide (TPR) repeat protein